MKAGASKRDITVPEFLGNPDVHDPLFARVLVLDDGDNAVAIITLDILNPFFAEVRERIKEQLGIACTLINCSHTHSDGRGGHNDKWRETVGQLIYDAVEEAQAGMAPVTLHAGRAQSRDSFFPDIGKGAVPEAPHVGYASAQAGHNRYGDAFTQEVVPWVNVLEARAADGRKVAVLFEHAAHPVVTMEHPGLSADYPGHAMERITEELGEEVVAMFAQGCSGNINGDYVSRGHERAEKTGRELGDAVLVALSKTEEIKADKFIRRSKTIMLPLQVPSMELWEKTIERIKSTGEQPPREGWPNNATTMKYMEILKNMRIRGERPEHEFTINLIMLGSEWGVVALPGEPFCEYETWVNAFAPFKHSMTFGVTNSGDEYDDSRDRYEGYIPTDMALAMAIKTPIVAESACMEAGSFPGFFHGVRVDGTYTCYAVGIERMIHEAIISLWTN